MSQSKHFSSNDNQSKYGNKKPYNNIPPAADEELAPILMTKEMKKDKSIIADNVETWNIQGHKIPVAFAPIKAGTLDNWMKFFNAQVRTYIATGGTDDFLSENGHGDDLSYDKFVEDAESDEDSSGFEPAQTETIENTILLGIVIEDLIQEAEEIDPKYGRIIALLSKDRTKGDILKELRLGKSQGYEDIKAAQALAYKLYHRD